MNPLILAISADVQNKTLVVRVLRDKTDLMSGETTREVREVSGPLTTLGGLGPLRTNLIAWVKAQTGYAGIVDSA